MLPITMERSYREAERAQGANRRAFGVTWPGRSRFIQLNDGAVASIMHGTMEARRAEESK